VNRALPVPQLWVAWVSVTLERGLALRRNHFVPRAGGARRGHTQDTRVVEVPLLGAPRDRRRHVGLTGDLAIALPIVRDDDVSVLGDDEGAVPVSHAASGDVNEHVRLRQRAGDRRENEDRRGDQTNAARFHRSHPRVGTPEQRTCPRIHMWQIGGYGLSSSQRRSLRRAGQMAVRASQTAVRSS